VIREIHEPEGTVRTNYYNRQARRAALCIGARRRHRRRRSNPLRRIWLTAYGRDLAKIAARIGDELSPEMTELLSPAGIPRRRASELDASIR
jgi:hypothetical protein